MVEPFLIARLAVSLPLMGLAAWQDVETREIDDRIWLALGILGVAILVADFLTGYTDTEVFLTVGSLAFALPFGYALYRFRLTGGADSKAIWSLALVFPFHSPEGTLWAALQVHPIFILTIIDNSLLLSLLLLFQNLGRNLTDVLRGRNLFDQQAPLWKRIALTAVAYKDELASVDWNKTFLLEDLETGEVRIKADIDQVQSSEPTEAHGDGGFTRRVWVTQGIPLVLYIALGLLVSVLFGDLLLTAVIWILS